MHAFQAKPGDTYHPSPPFEGDTDLLRYVRPEDGDLLRAKRREGEFELYGLGPLLTID